VEGAPIEKVVSVDYTGNIGRNQVEVAEGSTMPINLPGNYAFWAENQRLDASVDATTYRVQEDAVIRLDGVEIPLKAGDNVYAIISKINDSTAPLKASLDPTRNSLILETTTPHQIWPEDLNGGHVLKDLGLINDRFMSPPYNIADSAKVFGGSVFDMVIYLRDKLYTGDLEELGSSALRGIQDALNSVIGAVGDLGARYSRLDLNAQRISYEKPEIQKMDSNEVDLDISQAITELRMLDYTHEAALATTAKILKPTLLDFLR
jgi:flagellar hook-associated protein 3 FlgL